MVSTATGVNASTTAAVAFGRPITRAAIGTAAATSTPTAHSHGDARPARKAVSAPMPATVPQAAGLAPRPRPTRPTALTTMATLTITIGMPMPNAPRSRRTPAAIGRTSRSTGRSSVGARNSSAATKASAIADSTATSIAESAGGEKTGVSHTVHASVTVRATRSTATPPSARMLTLPTTAAAIRGARSICRCECQRSSATATRTATTGATSAGKAGRSLWSAICHPSDPRNAAASAPVACPMIVAVGSGSRFSRGRSRTAYTAPTTITTPAATSWTDIDSRPRRRDVAAPPTRAATPMTASAVRSGIDSARDLAADHGAGRA